jgi:hypothetical protein
MGSSGEAFAFASLRQKCFVIGQDRFVFQLRHFLKIFLALVQRLLLAFEIDASSDKQKSFPGFSPGPSFTAPHTKLDPGLNPGKVL